MRKLLYALIFAPSLALAADLEEEVILCLQVENPEVGYTCPVDALTDCTCQEGYAQFAPEPLETPPPKAATPS